MRVVVFLLALVCVLGCCACGRTNAGTKSGSSSSAPAAPATKSAPANSGTKPATNSANAERVDFATQIKPVLEARCQPCHFSGGKVYQRMPFDRAETIKTLGTKLFTRIKDENERRLIRDFLAQ